MKPSLYIFALLLLFTAVSAQQSNSKTIPARANARIIPGAERLEVYLPLIKGKRLAVFANQTSLVGKTHLVDTLLKLGVHISVLFGPEHGFRGTADAGEKVGNAVDEKTGIPIVSLFGSKRKPSAQDLKDVDVLLFDIQDVGTRFYTFISSMQEYMEAAIENDKPMILLDRPNPNGFYVDGPVLDTMYKSFVGMQPIPTVYGMTLGEYANMLLNAGWLAINTRYPMVNIDLNMDKRVALYSQAILPKFNLTIIKCSGYTHKSKYRLPVKPSPNLPDMQSVYLYGSTCIFEGTVLSEGRGTPTPFQVFGHPSLPKDLYSFTPQPNEGAKTSKHYGKVCYGWNLGGTPEFVLKEVDNHVQIKWLIEAYRLFPVKDSFFIIPKSGLPEKAFFTKLAGNATLMQQVKAGTPEADIRKTWEPGLAQFKKIRKKYLLYPDFE